MDFLYYWVNVTGPITSVISQQTGKVADVLNNILIVFLIIYKVRKEKEEVKDFHEPIFRQLFYIAGGIVFSRNLLWLTVILNKNHTNVYMSLCMLLWSVDNLLITSTLMFTFLAAIQRIIIMYIPRWKVWLTGKPLTRFIIVLWLLSFSQYLVKAVYSYLFHFEKNFIYATLMFRLLFFLFTLASNLIYHHFYKLMSNFTDQHQHHRMHLLYQFVPIHTILSIFTFTQCIMEFFLIIKFETELCVAIYMYMGSFLTPFIPTVISLSYIASRDNLRALITAVLRPVWEDITS